MDYVEVTMEYRVAQLQDWYRKYWDSKLEDRLSVSDAAMLKELISIAMGFYSQAKVAEYVNEILNEYLGKPVGSRQDLNGKTA